MNSSGGNLTITFDLELGWGSIQNNRWRDMESSEVFRRTRTYVTRLLQLFDRLDIPVTWATVGGLLDRAGSHHLDHLPARIRQRVQTALTEGKKGSFYGYDLLEQIDNACTNHSIASHTYSHFPFHHPDITKETVLRDLDVFQSRIRRFDGSIDTFVFPRNILHHVDAVRERNYRLVRTPNRYLQKTDHRLCYGWKFLRCGPPLSVRRTDQNVVFQSGSMRLNPGRGHYYKYPLVVLSAFRGLRKAIRQNGTLLIWDHPFSFAECPGLFALYKSFLERAATYRDRGLLSFKTFGEKFRE